MIQNLSADLTIVLGQILYLLAIFACWCAFIISMAGLIEMIVSLIVDSAEDVSDSEQDI